MRRGFGGMMAAVVSSLAIAGCAPTISVSPLLDQNTDMRHYHTYSWTPADASSIGDPGLNGNFFFQDHMQGEVNRQMAARGFKGPRTGSADLLIHYHASLTERLNPNVVDTNYGYCYGSCRERTTLYDAGTIVIDIVDADTKRVIWRGWARDGVESAIANPDRLARTIHDAVAAIMSDLPRSSWAPTSTQRESGIILSSPAGDRPSR